MDNFEVFDWSASVDVETQIAAVPAGAEVKGILFGSARRAALRLGGTAPGRDNYGPLTSYPTVELMRVLVECARVTYPEIGLREALRRLGHEVFPALRDNPAGRFLFSVAGNNFKAALRLIGQAYTLFSSARAQLVVNDPDRAVVELRGAWTFPDAYHVGVIEGALHDLSESCELRVRRVSPSDIDLELRWL